jgi:hypothetical protein
MSDPLPIIGWREWVALPDFDVPKLKVKIDTGARTSSLHAVHFEKYRRRGREFARFVLHPDQKSTAVAIVATAPIIEFRHVTSSSGHRELRPVIETRVSILGQEWPIEVTLASRDLMGFRMLLGRQAIVHRFTVDPSRSFLGRKRKRSGDKGRPR